MKIPFLRKTNFCKEQNMRNPRICQEQPNIERVSQKIAHDSS